MFCPKCGTENPAEARFCGNCAARLPTQLAQSEPHAAGAVAASGSSGPSAAIADQRPVSTELKIGVILLAIFIPWIGAAIALILGVMYAFGANQARHGTGWLWIVVAILMTIGWLEVASNYYSYFG